MLQNVKKALANSEPSTHGTKRTIAAPHHFGRFRGTADIEQAAPKLQQPRADLSDSVLRAMEINPALGQADAPEPM
jgi:hypothetical protein